ncbi:hypothetical protein K439DRAFT_1398215, partial [Ramaria rubella]
MSRIEDSDLEVSIAVSVPSTGAEPPTSDGHDAFENFFSEHGFEYVNGSAIQNTTLEHDIDAMEGIPGIGRVIDALSTILWPSMVQKASSRRFKSRSIVSIPGPPGEEDGLRSLLSAAGDRDATENNSALQREKAALEKWLEEGADDEKDPWDATTQTQDTESPSTLKTPRPAESGFDDNFSDFVSAPAQPQIDEDDPALPSQTEIAQMSQRIFQTDIPDDAGEEETQAPFDLSRVLTALEAMKDEIAGISDEEEKRKAAAKVALSLVYGL